MNVIIYIYLIIYCCEILGYLGDDFELNFNYFGVKNRCVIYFKRFYYLGIFIIYIMFFKVKKKEKNL